MGAVSSENESRPGDRAGRPGDRPPAERGDDEVKPLPPGGWAGKLLLFFPAALFIFLIAVLLWGILADLLAGYR